MSEYDGPMKKMVGLFAHALERQSVFSHPDYQGAMLCDFGAKDKFKVFLDGSIEPLLLLTAAFDAGVDQATNSDPTFGLGAAAVTGTGSDCVHRHASANWMTTLMSPG
jgi:hypothetical protein